MPDYEDLSLTLRATMRPIYWLVAVLLVAAIGAEYLILTSGGSTEIALGAAVGFGFAAAAVAGWSIALSPRTAALEVLYVGSWLSARYWAENGLGRVPRRRAAAQRWLATHSETPESRSARAAMLLWVGDYAGARRVIGELDHSDPVKQFDAVHLGQLLEHLEGRDPDTGALRQAGAALESPTDRLNVIVSVADLEARRALASGKDPWAPLTAARHRLVPFPRVARASRAAALYAGLLIVLSAAAALIAAWVWRTLGWIA